MKKIIPGSLLIILFTCFPGYAQLSDTIRYSLQQKPRFFLSIASFNTFIDGEYANIGGLRMGLNFNQKIRFGVGFFKLANNAVVSTIQIGGDSVIPPYFRLKLSFVTVSAEYFFYNDYPWQFTVTPFQLGIGRAYYEYIKKPESVLTRTASETILLYQPEVSAQYSIFKWIGVGVTSGYRITLLRSKKQTENLSAPTFSFDIRIFLDALYKELFIDNKGEENLSD